MKDDRLCARETQRRDRRTAVAPEPSAPARLNPESHAAGQLRRQRSISSSQHVVRSPVQTLQDHTQQDWIGATLYADQCAAGKLDMDRSRSRPLLYARCLHLHLACGRHRNWKQACRCHTGLRQLAALEGPSPLEDLVRVHPVRPGHQRYARAWLQGQLYDPPLLGNRSPPANSTSPSRSL